MSATHVTTPAKSCDPRSSCAEVCGESKKNKAVWFWPADLSVMHEQGKVARVCVCVYEIVGLVKIA